MDGLTGIELNSMVSLSRVTRTISGIYMGHKIGEIHMSIAHKTKLRTALLLQTSELAKGIGTLNTTTTDNEKKGFVEIPFSALSRQVNRLHSYYQQESKWLEFERARSRTMS
ncbi:hypothetical protein J6590_085626 [Homalodisca vitripennis]|nr:hypothetical protein J6590_085626 [Homalodisca vitripennis]